MGSININYIRKPNITKSEHLYSDIKLDLELDHIITGNYPKSKTEIKDVRVAYDEDAIKNSLTNLLNTNPGQRMLYPEYGLNFKRLLFMPVSDTTASLIGTMINDVIYKWEKRVEVQKIYVTPIRSEGKYIIGLQMYIPSLGKPFVLNAELIKDSGVVFKG